MLIFTHVVCCLHYNFLLSRIAMLKWNAKISRAGTTIAINVIVVLPRNILACFGNLPESNRAFYEFMIYRNVQ